MYIDRYGMQIIINTVYLCCYELDSTFHNELYGNITPDLNLQLTIL